MRERFEFLGRSLRSRFHETCHSRVALRNGTQELHPVSVEGVHERLLFPKRLFHGRVPFPRRLFSRNAAVIGIRDREPGRGMAHVRKFEPVRLVENGGSVRTDEKIESEVGKSGQRRKPGSHGRRFRYDAFGNRYRRKFERPVPQNFNNVRIGSPCRNGNEFPSDYDSAVVPRKRHRKLSGRSRCSGIDDFPEREP